MLLLRQTGAVTSVRQRFPGITGFSPVNIWRMRTCYDTYADREDLSALLKEVTWTNHTIILSGAKTDEVREFYSPAPACRGVMMIIVAMLRP